MSEAGLLRLRGGLGWLAATLLLCAGLSLTDYFVDTFRTGPNTFSLLPGGAESLSGPLPPDAADASAMLATIDRPGLDFAITTQTQGFWLGNRMWQGTVRAAPDAAVGTATLSLRGPGGDPSAPAQVFVLRIFQDRAAQDAASPSYLRRAFGLSPIAAAAGCAVAALAVGACVYLVSRRLEAAWARAGKAVVYMTKKTPDGLLVSFGLGTSHGLAPGQAVTVNDDAGLAVAMATVVRCSAEDATALVVGDHKVALGSHVRLAPTPPPVP